MTKQEYNAISVNTKVWQELRDIVDNGADLSATQIIQSAIVKLRKLKKSDINIDVLADKVLQKLFPTISHQAWEANVLTARPVPLGRQNNCNSLLTL